MTERIWTDLGIDLETLGTDSDAVIVSIGAIFFNRDTGEHGPTFYRVIDVQSCLRHGMTITGPTLAWWMKQSEMARDIFEQEDAAYIGQALGAFQAWVVTNGTSDMRVWGNGATFDVSIVENAFRKAVGTKPGWHFAGIRDQRTLVDMAEFDITTVPPVGTAHNALDDATFQANVVIAATKKLREALRMLNESEEL